MKKDNKKKGIEEQKKQRTGGVSDLQELFNTEDIEEFANDHNFPDPNELKMRLDKAYTSFEIFRRNPTYSKEDAKRFFKKVKNGIAELKEELAYETYFTDVALRYTDITAQELLETLQRVLGSVENTEHELHNNKIQLANAKNRLGRPQPPETGFLEELKKIHYDLTGLDSWVTTNDEYSLTEMRRYEGAFFEFAYECLKKAECSIERGTLRDRINELHKRMNKAKRENS